MLVKVLKLCSCVAGACGRHVREGGGKGMRRTARVARYCSRATQDTVGRADVTWVMTVACTKHHSIVGTTAGSICPWVPLGAYVPAGPVRNKRRRPEDTSTLRPPLKLQSLVNQMMLLNHGGAQLVSEGFADNLSVQGTCSVLMLIRSPLRVNGRMNVWGGGGETERERENDGLYSKYRERGGERRV